MKTIVALILGLPMAVFGQGFYSFPNPTFGTAYATNVSIYTSLSLGGFGGPWAASDGVMTLRNNSGSSFDRLVIGPAANSSWPSIRANGTTLQVRLGDHSGWAPLSMGNAIFNGTVLPASDNATDLGSGPFSWKDIYADGDVFAGAGGRLQFSGRSRIESSSDGVLSIRTAASGNMTRVLFGTGNSSGQALSFSTALISATDGLGTQIPFAALSYTLQDRTITHSTASPESAVTAPSGSLHLASISGVGSIWVKGSGTGNTGWLKTATVPDVATLTYSGTDVTVTAGKGPLQQSQLTCTNDFTLRFTSLAARDSGTIYVAPAATNCTVTLPNYVFGLGARTLTITGGTGNTNYTKIAWEVDVIGGTNRVAVNAGNYF